jgi:hypothetical protein
LTGGDGTIGSPDPPTPRQPDVTVLIACRIDRVRQRGDQPLARQMLMANDPQTDILVAQAFGHARDWASVSRQPPCLPLRAVASFRKRIRINLATVTHQWRIPWHLSRVIRGQ